MLQGFLQGKQKWVLANVVRHDDAEGRNQGKTFEFVFPEFVPEHTESQRFWFGGAEWFFSTEKNNDDGSLGVYLSLAQDIPGFSLKVKSYKFVAVDQEDESFNIEKSSVPKVFSYSQGWGFHKFIKLSELKRSDRSFLRTNRFVLRLEMSKATAIYDHYVDLATLKNGGVGKFSFDAVDWMVRAVEHDGAVSAHMIKVMSSPGVQYCGKVKLTLVNDNPENSIKKKLDFRTWTAQKTHHGADALLKVAELRSQKGWIRAQNATPSPTASTAATPPAAQILIRFEIKHMISIIDAPIPNLSAALTGSSLAFSFDRQSWTVTCKKDANNVSIHLNLQGPSEHKTYHTFFSVTVVSGKADDDANNIRKNFGTATFYKYKDHLGFSNFATVEELTKIRAVVNNNINVRIHIHKLDIATTYLDATVAKGGAAAVKLAKDEIEKFRKYYYSACAELKAVKQQLASVSSNAQTLQSKQGKFQLELEPLQMALQAKTEAADTLLSDLEAERQRAAGLKRDLDKARESLGFMSMLWLENVRHVSSDTTNSEATTSDQSSEKEHTAMATLDILNTLRGIVEETGPISSKQLRKEYKKKKGSSLRETLQKSGLGTPLAFLEANLGTFQFEEPVISLKSKKQIEIRISQADMTSYALKVTPPPENVSFLNDAFEFVTKFLPQVLPLPIPSLVLSGAAGKGVSLAGSTTIDVVVFIDKVPDHGHAAWLPPILLQLQRVIKAKIPNTTNLGVTNHCVHFSFEGANINLYPTSQFASPETMYQTILKYPQGWYDAATAIQQVEFVKSQSEAVKSTIRILQAWNNAAPQPVEDCPSPYLIELLAIHACTPKSSGTNNGAFDPLSALSRFMEIVADFDNLRLFWEHYYKLDIVPNSIFTERPLVLDPANPINNLAKGFDIPAFKQRAKEAIESGFSSLNPIFRPSA